MAHESPSVPRKKSTKKFGNFTITCPDVTEQKKETSTYVLEVPSASTTLHYHGQTIDVNIDQFDTLRSLGSGCYGTVLAVMLKSRPEIQMAVKKILLETREDRRASTYTDLTTIQNVGAQNNPYIIAYYGAVIDKETSELLICVELMDASMERFYQTMHASGTLTDAELDRLLCRLTHNITSALHFLKVCRILHRDVKPQNILVNKQAVFKLCDFGISRVMRASRSIAIGPVQGTELYIPPELMGENAQPYGIRADMWALGLSLFEIIIGTQPFLQMSIFQRTKTIRTWTPVWPSNRHISDDMKELVISLLKTNVEERPKSYLDILDTPSVKNVNPTPSAEEQAFVQHVIDNLVPIND